MKAVAYRESLPIVLRSTLAGNFGTINAADLRRAHALLESGKARGKIVLAGV
jgi:NADPH2:quinone reductase